MHWYEVVTLWAMITCPLAMVYYIIKEIIKIIKWLASHFKKD